jgi:hypothetical protein
MVAFDDAFPIKELYHNAIDVTQMNRRRNLTNVDLEMDSKPSPPIIHWESGFSQKFLRL